MRILVVGMGNIGKKHYQILRDLGHNVDGIDIQDSFSDYIKRTYQVVFICTPTNLHQEQAAECAIKGIPCFIEKPFSNTWEGVDEIVALFGSTPNMVGCNLRFLPSMQKFREIVLQHCPFSVLSVFGYNLNKWREKDWKGYSQNVKEGGGIVLEAIHELDYLSWIWGIPTLLASMTKTLPLPGVEDGVETAATVLLRFSGGSIGTACLNSLDWSLERFCIASSGIVQIKWDFKSPDVVMDTDGGRIVYPTSNRDMYVEQDKCFLEAVAEGKETANPLTSHAKVLRLALDAQSIGHSASKSHLYTISE